MSDVAGGWVADLGNPRPIFILGLVYWIPMTPPLQYLTLSLRNLGFDTFTANLMTLPFTGLHGKASGHPVRSRRRSLALTGWLVVITLLGITYLSEVFGEMTLTCMMAQIWALPPLIYLNVVDVGQVNRWALYTVTTILVGFPNGRPPRRDASHMHNTSVGEGRMGRLTSHLVTVLPVQQGWASRNSNSVQGRTVSAATNSAFLQAGGIIGSNVYRDGTPSPPPVFPARARASRLTQAPGVSVQTTRLSTGEATAIYWPSCA